MANDEPEISVVIPVYNEASNLRELFSRSVAVLEAFGRRFEVVMVNDGSTDGSLEVLRELHASDRRLRVVSLVRNFGQTPALYAGFAHVRGQIVASLDADLQNPPEELVKLIEKLEEGYDVVQGWREERQDSILRKVPSKAFNAMVSLLMGARVRDLGCGLKVFRREVIDRMVEFGHHARYVPAEVVWLGANMAEVKVEHHKRAGGRGKYNLFSLLRLNFDMLASISTVPIKVVGMLGWLFSLIGFGMGALILTLRIVDVNYDPLASSLATVTALFFLISGVQLIATGLMCEYVGRIFVEVQNKPYYVVKEVLE